MKILHLAIMLIFSIILSTGNNTAHGIWIPESTHDLLEKSATIFVGNITATKVLQFEKQWSILESENGTDKTITGNYTLNLDEYTVNVEEYLKNPQNSTKITVSQPTIGVMARLGGLDGFKTGDHVLFYVEKLDGNNTYSPESFIIPTFCKAKDVITQKRPEGGNEFSVTQNGIQVDYGNFTADKPIQFLSSKDMNTLSGKSFDVIVGIAKNVGQGTEPVFSQEIHTKSKPCEWIASAEWEFTPKEGNYTMHVATKEGGIPTGESYTGFSVKSDLIPPHSMSPLKQFQSGISANNIICKEGLQLVIKVKDGSPACVKPDDAYILIYRGWAKEFIQSVSWISQSMCDGTEVPSGDARRNIFPVLVMSPNSTATVCVTYNIKSDWQSYQNKDVYPHGILETCCFVHMGWYSSHTSSNKFDILSNPLLFNVTGVYNGSKISVTYKIYAKSDSKGFYDTSVPFDECLSYPLAVGYSPSEVDATKFHADFEIPCFNSIEDVDSVKLVSGMTYREVQFP